MIDKVYTVKIQGTHINYDEDVPPKAYGQLQKMFSDIGLRMRMVGNIWPTSLPNSFRISYGEDNPKKAFDRYFDLPFELEYVDEDGNPVTIYTSDTVSKYSIRVIVSNGTFVFANPVVFSDSDHYITILTVYNKEYLGWVHPDNELRNTKASGASTTYSIIRGYLDSELGQSFDYNAVKHGIKGAMAVPFIDHLTKNGVQYPIPNPNVFQIQASDTVPVATPGQKFSINGQEFMSLGYKYVYSREPYFDSYLALRLI